MFCQKCGKEIADDVEFCQFCGAKTKTETEKPKEEDNGFVMTTDFQYEHAEGLTLWCRFWEKECE